MIINSVVAALAAVAAVLLLASGVAKTVRPDPTATMLATLAATVAPRLPRRPAVLRPVSRVSGVAEIAVAGAVLGVGGRVAAVALAVVYAVIAVVARQLARTAGQVAGQVSCGCFGRDDTPVTRGHVVLTGGAAVLAVVAAVRGLPAAGGLFADGVVTAVVGSLLVGLLAWAAYLSITALPALTSARRLLEAS